MWCPEGKLPGDEGCTDPFPSFNGEGGLLAELQTGDINGNYLYSGAGTIYISYDYDTVTAGDMGISFLYLPLDLTDLTLQGGWDFGQNKVVGTSTLALGSGYSLGFYEWGPHALQLKDINVTSVDVNNPAEGLSIGNWASPGTSSANVTLDHVTVTDVRYGISLVNNGDATLQNVTSTGNMYGVDIYSSSQDGSINVTINDSTFDKNGTGIVTAGNVNLTMTNSQANQNDYMGIGAMIGDGAVTLDGVTANENKGYGAFLVVGSGDINIIGGAYNLNQSANYPGYGITAMAVNGNVSLTNVTAYGNDASGAYLHSNGLTKIECGQDTGNGFYGLEVDSHGNTDVYGADLSGNGLGEIDTTDGITTIYAYDCNPEEDKQVAQPLYILIPQKLEELPAALPNGLTFASASKAVILSGADILNIPITLSFPVPADKKDANMVILWWNGLQWVELPNAAGNGRVVFDPGHLNGEFFQGQVNFDGFFALAYK
jgi:hypothetical protein